MVVRELLTRIGFTTDQASVRKANAAFGEMKRSARETGMIMRDLGKSMSLFVTLPLVGAGAAAVKVAADFETLATQFEVLTGSGEKAKALLDDIQDFSAGTPFQFDDLAKAGSQLLAFGVESEDVVSRLRQIGDVAAATGAPIGSLAFVFGQIRAQGKLTGERLNQLQERAVPISDAIAKTLGIEEGGVRDAVSKGQVTFDVFLRAFQSLSQEGGKAFGGIDKLAQTVSGRFSTLTDNMKLLAFEFGKILLPIVGIFVEITTKMLQSLRKLSPETKQIIVVIAAFAAAIGPLLLAMGSLHSVLGVAKIALGALGVATWSALAPFLIWPAIIGAAILAIEDIYTYLQGGESIFGDWINWLKEVTSGFESLQFILNGGLGDWLFDLVDGMKSFNNPQFGSNEARAGATSTMNQNASLNVSVDARGASDPVAVGESVQKAVQGPLSTVLRQSAQNFTPAAEY